MLAIGIFFMSTSLFFIFSTRQFAKFYTLGSIFMMISTFFLVGPMTQLKSMVHPSRIIATAIYIGSALATIYFALIVRVAFQYFTNAKLNQKITILSLSITCKKCVIIPSMT